MSPELTDSYLGPRRHAVSPEWESNSRSCLRSAISRSRHILHFDRAPFLPRPFATTRALGHDYLLSLSFFLFRFRQIVKVRTGRCAILSRASATFIFGSQLCTMGQKSEKATNLPKLKLFLESSIITVLCRNVPEVYGNIWYLFNRSFVIIMRTAGVKFVVAKNFGMLCES